MFLVIIARTTGSCDTIDRFPVRVSLDDGMAWVAETGSSKCAAGPAVRDVCEVPLDGFGEGMPVKLIPSVDERLD